MNVGIITYARLPLLTNDDRPLIAAFGRLGAAAQAVRWDAPGVDWGDFDLVVIRSCWDYHLRPRMFRTWLDRLKNSGTTVLNPVELVRWNMNKRYLAELENKGVAIPPTAWITKGDGTPLAEILSGEGWTDAVVKPTVSASATDTWRVRTPVTDEFEPKFQALAKRGDVMVQEFVREVMELGEHSLIFIAGEFSHAMLKHPAAGDFRVQAEYGGVAETVTCDRDIIAQADTIVTLLPQVPLYARIDGVVIGDTFQLMEAECIEPVLYLAENVASYDRFAEAALG